MSYQLITTDQQLTEFCHNMHDVRYLALDSEFVRTRTFYPQLGLLQLFDGNNVVLIDPLNITDWTLFKKALNTPDIEKHFHACSEDVEVFLHHFGFVPLPILDSQILASFLDNPLSSGYANLVKKYLDIDLDKSETRTDWLQRPLSDKQCVYAANDVYYLLPLIIKLKSLLLDKGWLNAAYEECANAVKRRCEFTQADSAYLHIKNAWQLRAEQLAHLQQLAAWRFNYAKSHDIALNFVIHEEMLWKMARFQPKSLAELSALGLKGKEIRLFGELLLSLLAQPVEPIAEIKRIVTYPDYKHWTTLIKEAANHISAQTELSPELLVSRRHIEQFIRWKNNELSEKPELLSGWRADLFSRYLS